MNYYFSSPEVALLLLTNRKRYLPSGRGTVINPLGTVMNQKNEEMRDDFVQGIELIELGDAVEETRQTSTTPWISDSCCWYTYLGE